MLAQLCYMLARLQRINYTVLTNATFQTKLPKVVGKRLAIAEVTIRVRPAWAVRRQTLGAKLSSLVNLIRDCCVERQAKV